MTFYTCLQYSISSLQHLTSEQDLRQPVRHHRLGLVRARVREDEQPAAARRHRREHGGLHESIEQYCLASGGAVGQIEDEGAWVAGGGEGDLLRGSGAALRGSSGRGSALEPTEGRRARGRGRLGPQVGGQCCRGTEYGGRDVSSRRRCSATAGRARRCARGPHEAAAHLGTADCRRGVYH